MDEVQAPAGSLSVLPATAKAAGSGYLAKGYIVKNRIVAAWKVLRGEWTATPRTSMVVNNYTSSGTGTTYTLTWTPPPKFNAREAGRRAVRKHAAALRLLAR